MSGAYVVLTLERTGSNLLCDALAGTGAVGPADEWFGRSRLHELAVATGTAAPESTPEAPALVSFDAYVQAIARRSAVGDVYGVKLHRYQYERLVAEGHATTPLDVVPEDRRDDVRWILLTRGDKDRQAISAYVAQQSGVYALPVDEPVRTVRHATPYWGDEAADVVTQLDRIRATIDFHERAWQEWIAESGMPVLATTYEELVGEYERTVREVLAYVAGTETDHVPPPRLRMQRDDRTDELLRLWRGETRP